MDSLSSRNRAFVSDLLRRLVFRPAAMSPRGVRLATALLLSALHAGESHTQDHLVRTFGQEQGLAAPPVWALAQDSTGFLWIGAEGGLFRFDGSEIRRWAAETIREAVVGVSVAPDGRIVVRGRGGSLFEVQQDGAHPLPLPGPARTVTGLQTLAFDERGVLWITYGDTVAYHEAEDGWHPLPPGAFQGVRLRGLKANAGGGVDVATDAGLWRILPNSAPRLLYSAPHIVDMVSTAPDRLLVLAGVAELHSSRVVEITAGGQRELISPRSMSPGRPISLVERHGTLWITIDRFLVAARPGEQPEVLGQDRGFESGGPLLVDHEGSLWLGSLVGLHQYPEPDTRLWAERDGLPSRHTRFLARTGEALWVGTWEGNAYLYRSATGWMVRSLPWDTRSLLCTDGQGTVWTSAEGSLLAIRDTLVTRFTGPPMPGIRACVPARDGGVWLGHSRALAYIDPRGPHVRALPSPPESEADPLVRLHDSRGRLWVGVGEHICHAPAARILAGTEDAWSCQEVLGLGHLIGMIELPNGTLWASSFGLGILVYRGDRWQPLPMDDLPTRTLFTLVSSPRGGVWMVGHGILQRVRERREGGWEVLEQPTSWHGLWASGGSDLIEEADGTLWIASSRGVTHIPPEIRFALRPVPPVALVEARVDDQPLPLEGLLRLPHHRNRVELRFAALSFRDPSQLRHQVRLGPGEPWSESNGRPSFRWVELRPGRHVVEYRASLDGVHWSPEPIRFAFEVQPAWYRAPWFLGLLALLTGTLAWSIYRARVSYLLGLERQRTRIALDLHDEVGSGLASVGILSGVIAADGLEEPERRRVATEIAAAAEELGYALSDIVWSLDPDTTTLQELGARLAEHGGRLCADDEPAFSARFPERWPSEPLDMTVCRNVLLVGLEALHNAVRHAGARTVELSLMPHAEGEWKLAVRDDGIGFSADMGENGQSEPGRPGGGRDAGPRGHGLPGMRRRAAEIGARMTVRSTLGDGTTIVLRFGPRPRLARRNGGLGARLRRLVSWRLA